MKAKQSSLRYVKHAFCNWWNYSALLLPVALSLISDNPAWLLIGAGLEIGYLYMQAGNPRYRRMVDSLFDDAREHDATGVRESVWQYLSDEHRRVYAGLEHEAARLEDDDVGTAQRRDPYYQDNRRKVQRLLISYLQLARAVSRYAQYIDGADEQRIRRDIERLQDEIGKAEERVREVKLKNVDVLGRRLAKLQKAHANLDYLSAQLETIEDTLHLVVEQAITLSDPRGSSMQIDNLLGNLEETEMLAAEMDAYLELQDGLTDEVIDIRGSLERD
ncbi:hypothetical protein KDL44_10820 [bacterium]|nr:hypothetical protein [bacterium]